MDDVFEAMAAAAAEGAAEGAAERAAQGAAAEGAAEDAFFKAAEVVPVVIINDTIRGLREHNGFIYKPRDLFCYCCKTSNAR